MTNVRVKRNSAAGCWLNTSKTKTPVKKKQPNKKKHSLPRSQHNFLKINVLTHQIDANCKLCDWSTGQQCAIASLRQFWFKLLPKCDEATAAGNQPKRPNDWCIRSLFSCLCLISADITHHLLCSSSSHFFLVILLVKQTPIQIF